MTAHEIKRDSKRAFRAVMREMNRSVRFDTPEELEVLRKNYAIALKRSIVGLFGGGAACGLTWKYAVSKRFSPVVAAWGAMAGATIGMFSIRQKLFLDLLSIPEDRSPFAHRAHEILEREMPQSPVFSEITRRRRELFPRAEASYGEDVIWTEPPPPPLENFKTLDDMAKDQQELPIIQAPARGRRGPSQESDWAGDDNDDESDSIYGEEGDVQDMPKKKPTTWEELRRRASRGF